MALQDTINQAIKDEITNDPRAIGYAGKTDDEILALLNSPEQKQKVVIDTFQSPMNRILSGMIGTKNTVSLKEVQDSKVLSATPVIP